MPTIDENYNSSFLTKMSKLGVHDDIHASNLTNSGQQGVGIQPYHFDGSTPLVLPPATIVCLHTPSMYDKDAEISVAIKNLVETYATEVSGIDVGYTVETEKKTIGHDGQGLEVPTQIKRKEVDPSFTFPEMPGNIVWNMIKQWIWDLGNPDTNIAMNTTPNLDKQYVMSAYSMGLMVIQFDPTFRIENIIDGLFITNMFPKDTTELGITRTIGTSTVKDRSIPFSGYAMHNDYTRVLCRDIAKTLKLDQVDYRKVATSIEDVEDAIKEAGLQNQINQILGT